MEHDYPLLLSSRDMEAEASPLSATRYEKRLLSPKTKEEKVVSKQNGVVVIVEIARNIPMQRPPNAKTHDFSNTKNVSLTQVRHVGTDTGLSESKVHPTSPGPSLS